MTCGQPVQAPAVFYAGGFSVSGEAGANSLYVVRNSAVKVDAGALMADWKLSPEGVLLTIPIAEASFWAKVSIIYHGPELSSQQTARIISRRWQMPIEDEWELRELLVSPWSHRPDDVSGFSGPIHQHLLEDGKQAELRVARCIKRLAKRHLGQSIAIVAQGRILTAFYSFLLGRSLGQTEWQSLHSPDLSVIDLSTWRVRQGFFSHLQR